MNRSIEPFVRETLGCNCPPEVFEEIGIDPASPWFNGLSHEVTIDIGGRLLVLIVWINDGMALQDSLSDYFEKGRRYRDEKGFNRFRLVIACNNAESARAVLQNRLQSFELDDRLHLHVLSQAEVPQFKVFA